MVMVWSDMSSIAGHSDKQASRMESGVIKFLLSKPVKSNRLQPLS